MSHTLWSSAQSFIQIALEKSVLQFGEFTLKSGRKSPYFFNAGLFNDGISLLKVGEAYASTIIDSQIPYDMLFGPAYKGIPLVCATAFALSMKGVNVPFAFNRKEAKNHGEGGNIIGAPLKGRVLILDDVITAGTAMRESIRLIQSHPAQVAGIVVGLDRQEKGQSELSTLDELAAHIQAPVVSVATLQDLIHFTKDSPLFHQYQSALENYQKLYAAG